MDTDKTPPLRAESNPGRTLAPLAHADAQSDQPGWTGARHHWISKHFSFCLDRLHRRQTGPLHRDFGLHGIPGVFCSAGLLMMITGVLLERKRKVAPTAFYPRIDLNDPAQRSAVISFTSFFVVFAVVSAAGSYKAYEFTESVSFCGQLCHTVMSPEYTAYLLSPHARVACADCHVGPGATWFVKSKLSGTRQVFHAVFNTFPRPIPTPVKNLRPAQETCEQCHWPKKFYGGQLKVFSHYASDEQNTLRQIRMIIKTGGGDPATGAPEGIHWHMNIGNKIEYVAADEKIQVIPYVRVEDLQGRVTEYYAKDSTLSKDQIAKAEKHRMD